MLPSNDGDCNADDGAEFAAEPGAVGGCEVDVGESLNGVPGSESSPPAAAFSFSLVFSRALVLAVVDRTAVVTALETDSLEAAFVAGGYANKLGRAFEVNSNFGAYDRNTISRCSSCPRCAHSPSNHH